MSEPLETLQASLTAAAVDASDRLEVAIRDLTLCHADTTRRPFLERSRRAVAEAANALRAIAELAARIAVRFPSVEVTEPGRFATHVLTIGDVSDPGPGDPVPNVGFEEAVEDLLARDPVGAADLEAIGASVADLYAGVVTPDGGVTWPGGFAAARAADRETASHVRDLLAEGLKGGSPTPAVVARLVRSWDWPSSFAETVARTNYATAATNGRLREAERIEQASGVRMGFRFVCVRDSDVRRGRPEDHGEDHLALDGLVARHDDPVWDRFSPPLGYNCRCGLEVVVGEDVPESFVTIPTEARAAPGFGRRSLR